jgi:hypothetical protein
MSIQEEFGNYLLMNKELVGLRKQQTDLKTKLKDLEKKIKEYMIENSMDSISLKEGEIVLYDRKISQTFKKDAILEKLTEKLKDSEKAEELTESILQNKKFVLENKIRAVIKKK